MLFVWPVQRCSFDTSENQLCKAIATGVTGRDAIETGGKQQLASSDSVSAARFVWERPAEGRQEQSVRSVAGWPPKDDRGAGFQDAVEFTQHQKLFVRLEVFQYAEVPEAVERVVVERESPDVCLDRSGEAGLVQGLA
jgi:hypothetical protein